MKSQKRIIATVVFFMIILTCVLPSYASGNISIFINGKAKHFNPAPIIENGRTLVPMRAFFESLGATINWDNSTKTVTGQRGNTSVKLTINNKVALANGTNIQLDVPPTIIDSRTYIPLRFVGESLGDSVVWDGKTKTITINSTEIAQVEKAKVHFIDVGQADCIYIDAPNNYDILIDAGNNADGSVVVNYLKSQNIDDIEIMVATHPHEDHIGGLDDVLAAFDVERIIDSGSPSTTKTYKDYWAAVQAEGAIYQEDADMTFDLGNNIKFFVIETGDDYSNNNDNSVLTKLDYNNVEFLFTGDIESDVESKILNKNIQADILKVGHHGSKSSTSDAFLAKVNPEDAVICVGEDNKYGHPHAETIDKLSNADIDVYMTKSGTVVVTSDGNTYSFNQKPVSSNAEVTQPVPSNSQNNVKITSISLQDEIATIKNFGNQDVDMTGWKLVSVTGNQTFYFPVGYILKAGSTVKVVSGRGASGNGITTLKWSGSYIWNNDGDSGELYNSQNQKVSSF